MTSLPAAWTPAYTWPILAAPSADGNDTTYGIPQFEGVVEVLCKAGDKLEPGIRLFLRFDLALEFVCWLCSVLIDRVKVRAGCNPESATVVVEERKTTTRQPEATSKRILHNVRSDQVRILFTVSFGIVA